MGQVIMDEREKPLMRMTYEGVPDEAEWKQHIDIMSDWVDHIAGFAGEILRPLGENPQCRSNPLRKSVIRYP